MQDFEELSELERLHEESWLAQVTEYREFQEWLKEKYASFVGLETRFLQ